MRLSQVNGGSERNGGARFSQMLVNEKYAIILILNCGLPFKSANASWHWQNVTSERRLARATIYFPSNSAVITERW